MKGVGNSDEVAPAHRDNKWFITARLIDMIDKAKILQRLQNVYGIAHPIGVPTNRLLASNLVDRFDTIGDEALFLIARELIGIVPYPAVGGCLMTPVHNFLSEIRGGFDRPADHER